jgi:hypothetical protein
MAIVLGALPAITLGADAVRAFNGTSDQIRVKTTSTTDVTGDVTIVALIRPGSVTEEDTLVALHDAAGTGSGYGLFIDPQNRLDLWNGQSDAYSNGSFLVDNQWQLVVATKGGLVPRFHAYCLTCAVPKWKHVNSSSQMSNGSSATAGGETRFGSWQKSIYYDGSLASSAISPRALSDEEVESLLNGYSRWLELQPAGMWIFNQVHLSHAVLDETGGEADELLEPSYRTAVVANASPISGDPEKTIFDGAFRTTSESQWLAETHWFEVQEVGSSASFSLASGTPPAGESHYGHFELKAGDERAELRTGLRLYEEDDVYVRFLARLSSGFPAEEGPGVWGQLIWQLHQVGSGSPPIALHVNGTSPGTFVLRDQTGNLWWQGPQVDSQWHEFLVRVNHSNDKEVGFVEAWMDGVQQKLANGNTRFHKRTMFDEFNYPKAGYYRDPDMLGSGAVDIAGYRIYRAS